MKFYNHFLKAIYKKVQIKTAFFVFICFGIVYIPASIVYYLVSLQLAKQAIDPIIAQSLISLRSNIFPASKRGVRGEGGFSQKEFKNQVLDTMR